MSIRHKPKEEEEERDKWIQECNEMLRATSNCEDEREEEEEELAKSESIEEISIMMMLIEAYHNKAIQCWLNEDNPLLIPYLYHSNAKNPNLWKNTLNLQ